MAKVTHVHKFKRGVYKTSGEKFFFCTGDTCDYRISVELALGKITECWRCGKPFKLSSYTLRLAKPHCPDCHKEKKNDFSISVSSKTISENKDSTLSNLQDRLNSPSISTIQEIDADLLD